MSTGSTRLCIVTPFQHGGGAEYQISLLIAALKRAGKFDVYYLAHHVDDTLRPEGYRVVRIGRNQQVPSLGYNMDLLPLHRALRHIGPQVIYQRVACGFTGICALYSCRHNARMIWHVAHDTDVMPRSLDTGRNLLRRRLEKWSVEFGLRHADRIVVQTCHQNSLLSRHYGRVADQVIPNFDAEATQPIDKSGPPIVVWIANLKPWKRPEIFVRLALALQDIPEAQFIMLGEAPSGSRNTAWQSSLMQSIAAAVNLRYLGRQSQDEVNKLLARACVFVNTSLHEGFPNTFIQAWMRDAVVVSLDVNPDGVLDREGVGVHARDEERLLQAVRELLTTPAARISYIQRARAYVQSRHSLRNVDALVRMIEDCARPILPST